MKQQVLLLEDIHGLGRAGEVVEPQPGHVRNFILPKKKGVIADKHTLKMQAKIQEERAKQAAVDLKEASAIAERIGGHVYKLEVKVDPAGHMYGSVSATDVAHLVQEKDEVALDKKWIDLPHPIKVTGVHAIKLKLKEDIRAEITLKIVPEGFVEPAVEEESAEEATGGESTEAGVVTR